MVKVSVPGKVHLIGEHAVVYGEPAIIAAIGRRIQIDAEKGEKVKVSGGDYSIEWDVQGVKESARKAEELWKAGAEKKDFSEIFSFMGGDNFKKIAIGHVLNKLGIDSGIEMRISGNVPIGAGVGSSASLATAIAKAISEVYEKGLGTEEVNQLAFEIERFKHGAPSGGDNSACCYGGLTWFQKGDPNTIDSLAQEIPYKLENFVLVYTKKPEKSTGELVQQVMNMDPAVRDPAVRSIGEATREMREVLKERDFEKMKDLINLAQVNLAKLGVSVPEIDRIHEGVKEIGGAAKGCGAMGGGIVLCYHEDKEMLKNKIRELGFEPWEAELAVEGVKREV
jgi:mevalonate kinase